MKIKTLLILLISIVILQSCGIKWDNTIDHSNTICTNYSNTTNTLPVGLIHDMTKGYRTNQKSTIDINLSLNDAHSIYFELETLKAFVHQIELTAKKNKANPVKSDKLGIRIYYASYPHQKNWGDKRYKNELDSFRGHPEKSKYGKLHTLIFVPTIMQDNMPVDFNPLDPDTYSSPMKNLSDKYGPNGNSSTMALQFTIPNAIVNPTTTQSPTSTSAQNHGGLFPPGPGDGHAF